jgi:hypothetical protein
MGMAMDHDGTVPIKSNKRPRQWTRDDWNMDKTWEDLMTEVEGREVKEVDDQKNFSPDSVASNKEHYEPEL